MSNPQTVLLPIEIPYVDSNGETKVRSCYLKLALEIADLITDGTMSEGFGEVTILGAVMPVEDPRDGAPMQAPKPSKQQKPHKPTLKYRAKKTKAA